MAPRETLVMKIEETAEQMLAQDNASVLQEQAQMLLGVAMLVALGDDDTAVAQTERVLERLDEQGWLAGLPGWIRMLRLVEPPEGFGVERADAFLRAMDGATRLRALGDGDERLER